MNKTAFIFDGQGIDFNDFGKDFYSNEIEFKNFIDTYKDFFNINELVYQNIEKNIDTEMYQPAAFLVEMGIAYLLNKKGIIAESYAGSSLGEYAALASAEYLKIEDGISILQKRGHLMNKALSNIDSEMRAVMFLDNDTTEKIALKNNCEVSNENSYNQVVISGLKEDIEKASNECLENGARRIIKLDSQGAFHSKYLKSISEEFKEFLKNYKFERKNNDIHNNIDKNNVKVYFNLTGNKEEKTNENIHTLLVKQLYSKVKFLQIIENMLNDGIDTFYEIGNGGNLAFHINNIAKVNNKEIKVYRINNYEDYIGVK